MSSKIMGQMLLLIALSASSVFAQDAPLTDKTKQAEKAIEKNLSDSSVLKKTFDPAERLAAYASPTVVISAANQAMAYRLKQVELEVAQLTLDHQQKQAFLNKSKNEDDLRQAIFARQLVYHPLILSVVIILVLTSTVLVVWQFAVSLKNAAGINESAVEVGKDGLKLKSTFVGLLMLVASYAFFYLYILEVYRIRPLDSPATQSSK